MLPIQMFRALMIFLKPILPQTAERKAFLGLSPWWSDLDDLLNGHGSILSKPCCNAWKASKWLS